MFEEKMEKGLFTFYWEENQKSKQPTKRGEVQSSLGAEATKQKRHRGIEEKRKRIKHHKTQRQQPQQSNKNQYSAYLQPEKEVKNIFIPHHITLSPKMDIATEKAKVKSIKSKRSKNITNTRNIQSDRQKYQKIRISLEALFFSQQSNGCNKKTLQIDQSLILSKSSHSNTLRPFKIRKATYKQENSHNQSKEQANQKLPIISAPQNQINTSLPVLFGKHSQKKLKSVKENFFIQKLVINKSVQEGSSIINIGVSSNDQYKMRWKKRKQEFLSLINKHISKQGLASN